MEGVASAGVLDVSPADGILANTAAPTVCITSDLPVTRAYLRVPPISPVVSWLALHVETVQVKPARFQLPGGLQ